jgi:hypothetical protein
MVPSSQLDINMVVPTPTPQLRLNHSNTFPLMTDAIVDPPVPITNPTQCRKRIPAVSNFVSGIGTVVSSAASAVSNRFSAP